MSHRMDEIKPAHYVTREECQEMIDDAIRKHNRNAGIISMFVGFFVLGLFSEGLIETYWCYSTSSAMDSSTFIDWSE